VTAAAPTTSADAGIAGAVDCDIATSPIIGDAAVLLADVPAGSAASEAAHLHHDTATLLDELGVAAAQKGSVTRTEQEKTWLDRWKDGARKAANLSRRSVDIADVDEEAVLDRMVDVDEEAVLDRMVDVDSRSMGLGDHHLKNLLSVGNFFGLG
jgi:hypothetical protein